MDTRRYVAKGREIWVIKAGFPNSSQKKNWSDYIFANTLKKYLEERGHYVIVESRDQWENQESADVVIALRGPEGYFPDRRNRDCVYILWNLSHPDRITDEEYNAYDVVCTGSENETFIQAVKKRVHVPVCVLPMCVDTELFYPPEDADKQERCDWIFVGNSRNVPRKSVIWAIKHKIPLKIWGKNWVQFIPEHEKYLVSDFMPNDQLPELYRKSKVTVDDHYADMAENGFINTRILESLACGLPVISDYSEVMERVFGNAVLYYQDEEEFLEKVRYLQQNYETVRKKVASTWEKILNDYSFASRALQFENLVDMVRNREPELNQEQMRKILDDFRKIKDNLSIGYGNTGEALCESIKEVQEAFLTLRFREQKELEALLGEDYTLFRELIEEPCRNREFLVKAAFDMKRQSRCIRTLRREQEELHTQCEDLKDRSRQQRDKYQSLMDRKTEVETKLQSIIDNKDLENQELREKLKKTYDEKSEINRKLQKTYDEKFERGVEIRRLKEEIAGIRKSGTYRLARILGKPVRALKRIFRGKTD